jgi:hypothetical protein
MVVGIDGESRNHIRPSLNPVLHIIFPVQRTGSSPINDIWLLGEHAVHCQRRWANCP